MSECVVRMEMPKSCRSCPLCHFVGSSPVCAIRIYPLDTVSRFFYADERPSDCPIICQLPEGHGRLVDKKEVKDWVENWLCVNKYYHPYSSSKSIPMSELYDVIQRMDAVVPAERSET